MPQCGPQTARHDAAFAGEAPQRLCRLAIIRASREVAQLLIYSRHASASAAITPTPKGRPLERREATTQGVRDDGETR